MAEYEVCHVQENFENDSTNDQVHKRITNVITLIKKSVVSMYMLQQVNTENLIRMGNINK